jgi:hypothetical protein
LFRPSLSNRRLRITVTGLHPIRHITLEAANGNGFIDQLAIAHPLARVRTDPTQYPGEGKVSLDNLQSILIPPLRGKGHVTLNVHTSRTGHHTGRSLCLLNGVDIWDRLGIGNIGGLPLGQAPLIFAGQFNRTNSWTFPATRALGGINISGVLFHPNMISSRFAFDVQNLSIGQDLHIQVSTKLDELGREDSHGTIVSGKGLIQLSHDPSDAGSPLYHIDEITRFGQVERGLNSGNASSHHHDSSNLVILCRQRNPIHRFS